MPAEDTRAEKNAMLVGARAVAEAVSKVADAAVAEITKTPISVLPELEFSGIPGGRFRITSITGPGFSSSGTVKVGGTQLRTTSWSTTLIEGTLPANVRAGEVVVQIDDKTARRGQFKS